MIEVELNRYDYAAALIFAEHFIKGKQQGLWSLQSISLYYQNKIFNALKIMGKVSEALAMSQEITQRLEAEALDTPESRRDL
ncbi:MAG: hypothetical protein KAH22_11425, partial [Thiotrichaceae bacterium]|nr:hypothetical protein [Thiotrichaceae bacterium]